MDLEAHCKECETELGSQFKEVHVWLDSLMSSSGNTHRKFRHHTEGLEKVRKMFGDKAVKAATLHIMSDHEEETGYRVVPDLKYYNCTLYQVLAQQARWGQY